MEAMGEAMELQGQLLAETADLSELWPAIARRLPEQRPESWWDRASEWLGAMWSANRRVMVAGALASCATLLVAVPLLRQGDGGGPQNGSAVAPAAAVAVNEVIVDSLQSGEHDMVLVNVHPDDMTTVIWLLEDDTAEPQPEAVAPRGADGPSPAAPGSTPSAPDAGPAVPPAAESAEGK